MPYAEWTYKARKLRDCLDGLSARFKLPDELVRGGRATGRIASETKGLYDGGLARYAAGMNGNVIVELLAELLFPTDAEGAERLRKLLSLRMSRRVLTLLWAFYTYEYENKNISALVKLAAGYAETGSIETPAAEMIILAAAESPVEALACEVVTHNYIINSFLADYDISRDAPLASAVARQFLTLFGREGFILNEAWLLRLIKDENADKNLISHYIEVLSEHEYISAVNERILEAQGRPEEPGVWDGFAAPLRQKFIRWCYLRDLRINFAANEKKLNMFVKYLPHIRGVKTKADTGGPFAIDFGDFAVLDENGASDFSYMCDKFIFERLTGETGLDAGDRKLFDARDFIIEEAEDDLIRLNFHSVGKLYVQETINILLGITPDTRSSKNIIAAKLKKDRERFSIGTV